MNTMRSLTSIAVLAALSAGAQAYNPATETFDHIVRVSGASAVDNGLFDRVDLDMCQNNANKTYLVQSGNVTTALGNYWGIACDAATASGVSGKVLFLKRSAGGSGQGVGPVNNSTAISFISRTSCTDADANGVYTCPTLSTGDVPDGGVSDLAPNAFEFLINGAPADGTNLSGNLEPRAMASLVFGIAVNTNFRNALQAAQFGANSTCVGAETEPCMPSLTKQQINSIFGFKSGQKTWTTVRVERDGVDTTAPLNGEALTATPGTAPYRTAPFDNKIRICRRVAGSGTQAQFNANFLGNPVKGVFALAPYDQTLHTSFSLGPIIWNGSGSSDVENCLEAYDTGTTKTITSATGSTQINPATGEGTGPTKAWAIGIQSVEKNANLAKPYRFIKVDGVAPTLENVWNGKYFDFGEVSCQTRTGDASARATFVKNACNLNVAAVVRMNLGSDSAVGGTGAAFGAGEQPFGVSGYLLPSTISGTSPDGSKFQLSNPVTNYTRFNQFGADPVVNTGRAIPFNTGDTSLDTNGSLTNAGGAAITPNGTSSW
jgi:hypothetical protein